MRKKYSQINISLGEKELLRLEKAEKSKYKVKEIFIQGLEEVEKQIEQGESHG